MAHLLINAVDSMAYLKAVDRQQRIGSNASTATGGCSNPPSRNSLPIFSSSASLKGTRLSSQAKPFVSSGLLTGGLTHVDWMPIVVNTQYGSPQQGRSQMQSYNEKAQEHLYLTSREGPACESRQLPKWFGEMIQEDVHRVEESGLRGRLLARDQSMVIPSRTPSPPYCSRFFPNVVTATQTSLLDAAETRIDKVDEANNRSQGLQAEANPSRQYPVKHTFIHYDVGQPKQFVKSASSPSILLHDSFRLTRMMSELHESGQCSPCVYLYHKEDGCRQGSDCRYCHMCPADEVKKRSKARKHDIKARKRALAARNAEASSLYFSNASSLD